MEEHDYLADWLAADAEAEKLEAEDEPHFDEIDDRGNEDGR
jgi:hypothetical protein